MDRRRQARIRVPVVEDLRELRAAARELNATVLDDLRPFIHAVDLCTFRRVPRSPSIKDKPSVSSTCSCLMALALTGHTIDFYETNANAASAVEQLLRAPWESSGLPELNAFTKSLVLRTLGFLREAGTIGPEIQTRKKGNQTIADIISQTSAGIPDSLAVGVYPATPAVAYWFIDGLCRLGVGIRDEWWKKMCQWAQHQFFEKRSAVVAENHALMDPVAMGMAACLCQRLRRATGETLASMPDLPPEVELRRSIAELFRSQTKSGLWSKYFALFHYRTSDAGTTAGSNYCFTFELLEAVLHEFGPAVIEVPGIFRGLSRAVDWCRQNRLPFSLEGQKYAGWNSGGDIYTLALHEPESWATAVVHMFLKQLDQVLSGRIQDRMLEGYRGRPTARADAKGWDSLIDIRVELRGGTKTTIKQVLTREIVDHVCLAGGKARLTDLPRRSCLLFGPPGTSKTVLVRSFSRRINWPLIEIDPSAFLKDGLENIYKKADDIFADLMDLNQVVVFFDEMDALVRAREGESSAPLDVTSRFLTTSMLPKLAKLHDHGPVIFFMATNHFQTFDPAITRPGRFDLLLCVGPPAWEEKLNSLVSFLPKSVRNQADRLRQSIASWTTNLGSGQMETLDGLTYAELQSFMETLFSDERKAAQIGRETFMEQLERWGKVMTLRPGSDLRKEYDADRKHSRVQ